MKAIETKYNGYRFRSRTEARWAFFFDEIYLPYEYEKEGFVLEGGVKYLPDFFIPSLNIWIEIKGSESKQIEFCKAQKLSKESKNSVLIITGSPDPAHTNFTLINPNESVYGPGTINRLYYGIFRQEENKDNKRMIEILHNFIGYHDEWGDGNESAYIAARSARFEYQELVD